VVQNCRDFRMDPDEEIVVFCKSYHIENGTVKYFWNSSENLKYLLV
jgi:hypothetical protein